jgi:hypothetical protein
VQGTRPSSTTGSRERPAHLYIPVADVVRGGEHSSRAVERLLEHADCDGNGRFIVAMPLAVAKELLARYDVEATLSDEHARRHWRLQDRHCGAVPR